MANIQQEIIGIVRKQAQLDHDPDPHANLISEAGIDSLMALRILASIEKNLRFGQTFIPSTRRIVLKCPRTLFLICP